MDNNSRYRCKEVVHVFACVLNCEKRIQRSWNVLAHAQNKRVHFLIRSKDINSNGILSSFDFDELSGCFDIDLPINLVRLKQCIDKNNPSAYRCPTSTHKAVLLHMIVS
jgi:hypothetical protein